MKKQISHSSNPRAAKRPQRRKFLGVAGAGLATLVFPQILLPRRALAQGGVKEIPVGGLIGAACHNAGLETARAKGIVEAQGLRIAHKEYAAGANLVQAIAAGDVVAGVCGGNPTLLGAAQGLDIKILANANVEGSVLIVGPGVKSPKDLNGRKVGTPGIAAIQDTLLLLYEKKLGVKTDHVFVKVTDMPTMLRNEEIAGYIVWEATGTAGLAMSGGRILATSTDIYRDHECCVLVASGKFLRDEPDAALRLVRSHALGLKYAIAHHDELVQLIAKRDALASPELARSALTHVRYKYPPVSDPAGMAFVVRALLEAKKIERERVPDVERFVANVIDNRVVQSLNL